MAVRGTAGTSADSVVLTIAGNAYAYQQAGSVVNLNSNWTSAEFNIYGNGSASQYSFAENVDLVVELLIDNNPTSSGVPSATNGGSYTGETNNLTVLPYNCSWGNGNTTPGIQFQESQISSQPMETCQYPNDPNWTNTNDPFDAMRMGTDLGSVPLYSCRVNMGGLQPGKTKYAWQNCDVGYNGSENWGTQPYQTLVPAWADDTNGNVPSNAYRWGTDLGGYPLYVCRAFINNGGGLQVGKVRPGLGACLIPYGGQEVSTNTYQVLTEDYAVPYPMSNQTPTSVPGQNAGALVGGYDSNNTPLYLCAAQVSGHLTPGKIAANWTSCDVPYNGVENYVSTYQVLIPEWQTGQPSNYYQAGNWPNGTELGICQASYQGSVQVGQYNPNSGGFCNFGYGGTDVALTSGYWVFTPHP
jgi:hypothetical protein